MSYKKREKRRAIKKTLRIALISFILLYLIFRSVPILLSNNLKTSLAEIDTLKDEFQCDGVVIKKEDVFLFDGDGMVEKKIDEGERVPVGKDVANFNFLKDTSGFRYQIEEIDNAIRILNHNDSPDKALEEDKSKILKEKEELIDKIQKAINTCNFKDINSLNRDLYFYENKESGIYKDLKLLESSVEELEEAKKTLKSKIDENKISYKTDISGIISYEIDGYESIFTPEKIENYSHKDLDLLKKIDSEENLNGFKIIDNFTWYLALKIDDMENISSYEEGDFMNVNFVNRNDSIDGKIIKINKTGEKALVILRFRDYFHDYYKIRFSEINVLKSSKKGYKIPKEVIVEKDGQEGVYIKDFNGIVKFRHVKIIGEEDDYIYLDMGKLGNIELSSQKETVKTIGCYDEIFLKPNRIEEGQIVN